MSHYKPYPVYKDSGVEWIGEVPEGWEIKRLRHVAEFTNSNVDKKSYDDQENVTLCNYTDVYYNEFITAKIPFMPSTANRDEINQFSLRKGDVLITKDSEAPDDIGIPSLVVEDVSGVVCGYHLTLIRSSDLGTARILHRSLQSHPTKAHFFVEAPGITRYGLSQDAIGDLKVCFPPPEDRGSISDYLDRQTARIDALITKKTRFIELLKEKRQALITHAVTKGLDPNVKMKDSGVEWIGEVPEHWEHRKVAWDMKMTIGWTPPTGNRSYYGGQHHWVTIADLSNSRVSNTKQTITDAAIAEMHGTQAPAGSLLFSYKLSLGQVALLDQPAYTNEAIAAFYPCKRVHMSFWKYAAPVILPMYSRENIYGSKLLNQELMNSARMFLPDITEQATIATQLDRQTARIDLIIEKTQRSIDLLKERRSALITAAVTGQIDLRETI